MTSSPLMSRLTGLALGILALSGCSRNEPVGQRQAIDPATMVTAEETAAKTFKTGAAPSVVVDIFLGPIEITTGEEESVRATITKRGGGKTKAEAEEALKEIMLTFTEEKDGIRIVALPPKEKSFHGGMVAKVEVPAGATLALKTSLGKIDVNAPSPKVSARTSQGPILIRGAKGILDLTTSLANIDVDAPCTEIAARNSQGAISIRGATGDLVLVTSLGKIEVSAPCGAITAQNSQGAINVKGAKGPLRLGTSLGPITVNADGAEIEAANSQGAINIQGVKGRVRARTSLSNIAIEASDAVVDAENSQGGVTFSGNLAAGKHSFRTSLGNVSLTLPTDAGFHIDAEVSLGRITNAFAVKQMEKSTPTRLIGTVGDNRDSSVQVNVNQGQLTINKGLGRQAGR